MALFHSPRIVTSNLVFCLDAANIKSYSGSGTSYADLSPSRKNSTLTNGPTYSAANGGVFVLDGTNDYIDVPSQKDAQLALSGFGGFTGADTNAFTVEIWIKTSQIAGSSSINAPGLIARDNGDIWANLTLYNGYVYYVHYNSAWLENLKSTTMVSNNVWHQIVYVNYTDRTGSIFVDSNSEVTGSSALNTGNWFSPDNIGWGYSLQYFSGSVGPVRFYDKSLTAAEIRQNFLAHRGRFGL